MQERNAKNCIASPQKILLACVEFNSNQFLTLIPKFNTISIQVFLSFSTFRFYGLVGAGQLVICVSGSVSVAR